MATALERATSTLLDKNTPMQAADLLGIDNTHVYRARAGDFTRTYVDSLRAHGYLPAPYQRPAYFQIRRDDAYSAAQHIKKTLGADYARAVALELLACGAFDMMHLGQLRALLNAGHETPMVRFKLRQLWPRMNHRCELCAPGEVDDERT